MHHFRFYTSCIYADSTWKSTKKHNFQTLSIFLPICHKAQKSCFLCIVVFVWMSFFGEIYQKSGYFWSSILSVKWMDWFLSIMRHWKNMFFAWKIVKFQSFLQLNLSKASNFFKKARVNFETSFLRSPFLMTKMMFYMLKWQKIYSFEKVHW